MTPDKARSLANDISCVIATLQAVADDLSTAYPDSDYDDYNEPEQEIESAPEPEPELTVDDVRKIMAEKSRQGLTAQMRDLLKKYGVNKVSELKPKQYAAIIADAGEVK